MRQWNVGDGLDFCHVQYPEVGLPLVESIQEIVIGAEEVRHPALPSSGAVEHPTKSDTIDRAGMDAEANDPATLLLLPEFRANYALPTILSTPFSVRGHDRPRSRPGLEQAAA